MATNAPRTLQPFSPRPGSSTAGESSRPVPPVGSPKAASPADAPGSRGVNDSTEAATREAQAGTERRIEVSVTREHDGSPSVVIRDLSYGKGIGWYAQKSIHIDADQVDALLKAVCCARRPASEMPERLSVALPARCPRAGESAPGTPAPHGGETPRRGKIISLRRS